jgi:hypothetical protein
MPLSKLSEKFLQNEEAAILMLVDLNAGTQSDLSAVLLSDTAVSSLLTSLLLASQCNEPLPWRVLSANGGETKQRLSRAADSYFLNKSDLLGSLHFLSIPYRKPSFL